MVEGVERAEVTYLDTHVLVRLYEGEIGRMSRAVQRSIETDEVLVSPAAVLEIELLHEIGRLRVNASRVVEVLAEALGLSVCDLPFSTVVQYALKEGWSRDPFDRLIVAHAKANGAPLITKDERIHQHYRRAVW
ncbi:MAG: type II toxin-antitoxin system VapC family toxin [Acidobacteria bacterium]|nr:type II toxin-antitoxin system VapC family toxin [Acidobacteriota bacterium]